MKTFLQFLAVACICLLTWQQAALHRDWEPLSASLVFAGVMAAYLTARGRRLIFRRIASRHGLPSRSIFAGERPCRRFPLNRLGAYLRRLLRLLAVVVPEAVRTGLLLRATQPLLVLRARVYSSG